MCSFAHPCLALTACQSPRGLGWLAGECINGLPVDVLKGCALRRWTSRVHYPNRASVGQRVPSAWAPRWGAWKLCILKSFLKPQATGRNSRPVLSHDEIGTVVVDSDPRVPVRLDVVVVEVFDMEIVDRGGFSGCMNRNDFDVTAFGIYECVAGLEVADGGPALVLDVERVLGGRRHLTG